MTNRREASFRPERVAARVQEELSLMLAREFSDPRLTGLVVSGVTVTDDLSLARVAFVLTGDDPDGVRVKRASRRLRDLAGMIRAKLSPRLGMRRTPELEFEYDAGREEVARLDAVLYEVERELKASEAKKPPEGEGSSGEG
jgi:ribosome-binding factor A